MEENKKKNTMNQFKNKYKLNATQLSQVPKVKDVTVFDKEGFRDYIENIMKMNFELKERVKSLRDAEFIGKYAQFIVAELSEDIERLKGTTMMVHQERTLGVVSDRSTHINNASIIAYKIAKGILKNEDIAKGISVATLLHDLGQPALGHDGENMSLKVSTRKQGGPRPHNATGAIQILFRCGNKIRTAINKGITIEIIKDEAIKRNISIEELSSNLNEGKEYDLENRIKVECDKLKQNIDNSIRMLSMATGRHNGERGTANIIPNYEIKFEDFIKILKKCFVYEGADKEMQSANLVDAIVKISDQISSIPYDIIDGKKGGVVIEIPEDYAEPVSQILEIEKKEALKRLRGNDLELCKLVKDLQEKLIGDLVSNSNKHAMKLGLSSWLYGKKDRITGKTTIQGLRMPTYSEYLPYISGEEEIKILQEAWYKCTEVLVDEILQQDRMFSRQLNAIFRMDYNDTRRKIYEENLIKQYNGRDEYKDFIKYILETTPEEYQFIKQNCHEYGVNLFRKKLETAKQRFKSGEGQYASSNGDEIEQGILNYIYSSKGGIKEPNGKEYSDDEINQIYRDINNMRSLQGKKKLLLQRDERIASQLALGYIESRFNDAGFIDFCIRIGIISKDAAKIVSQPYDPVSNRMFIADGLLATTRAYEEAEQEI